MRCKCLADMLAVFAVDAEDNHAPAILSIDDADDLADDLRTFDKSG